MAMRTRSTSSSKAPPARARTEGGRLRFTTSTVSAAKGRNGAGAVVDELGGAYREESFAPLLVGRARAQYHRPGRPGVVSRPARPGHGEDLELGDRGRALAVHRAEAVGPGVATADDGDPLSRRIDRRRVEVALAARGSPTSSSPWQSAPREARGRGRGDRGDGSQPAASTTASNSARSAEALSNRGVGCRGRGHTRRAWRPEPADSDPGAELCPLGGHLGKPPVEDGLLQLEGRDAVAEQAPDPLGALEYDNAVTGTGELLGRCQAGGARADDRHLLAGRGAYPGRGEAAPEPAAHSAISSSTCFMSTGSETRPSTQEPSQGAGQRRPVNSGKLFVAPRRSLASAKRPEWTRSFHSGIKLPSGQPSWQKAMPQLMQRAACSVSSSRSKGR